MKRTLLILVLTIGIGSAQAQQPAGKQATDSPLPAATLSDKEQQGLRYWIDLEKTASEEVKAAETQLSQSAVWQLYQAAIARQQAARLGKLAAFNETCGEHLIKPSDCTLSDDGKWLARKSESKAAPRGDGTWNVPSGGGGGSPGARKPGKN